MKNMHEIIYDLANQYICYYDPCKWKDEQCERDRFRHDKHGACCSGCSHLTKQGCSIRSLGCKLQLCSFISAKYPDLVLLLESLKEIAYECGIEYHPRKE